MNSFTLLEDVSWNHNNEHAHAEAVYVGERSNVLRWSLLPGQSITPSITPSSPVHVIVLQGTGIFYKQDGSEVSLPENTLVVFEPGEMHSVRAENDPFVCVAILQAHPKQK